MRPFTRLGLVVASSRPVREDRHQRRRRIARALAAAAAAERAGFDMVWVDDMGAPSGDGAAWRADDPTSLDAFVLLGACATRTVSIGMGTLSTPVTARRPAVLAKVVSTLDVVSRGRTVLGIGAGGPSAHAAERLAEGVTICRRVLANEAPTVTGDFFRVAGAPNRPPAVRTGGVPIAVDTAGLAVRDLPCIEAAMGGGATAWPAALVVRDGAGGPDGLADEVVAAGHRHDNVTTIRVFSSEVAAGAPEAVAGEALSVRAAGFDAVAVSLGALVHDGADNEEAATAVETVGAAVAGTVRGC